MTPNPSLPSPKLIVGAIVGLILVVILATMWPWVSVPTGYRGVVTQFGRIIGIEQEGLAFIPPWQKLNLFNIRAEKADIENAEGSTADTQPVHVSLTVRYSIQPDKVSEVFEKYSKTGELDSYVATATRETFKAVTAKYTAPELITKRSQVSSDVKALLMSKISVYGAQVINIDMTNFGFSDSYMKAINNKVTQEQEALAAEKRLITVQNEQKQKVAVAEAEAAAVRAQADGEAYATLKNAQASAEALKIQNAALAQNRDVLELRRIEVAKIEAEKWNGQRVANQYFGTAPIQVQSVGAAGR